MIDLGPLNQCGQTEPKHNHYVGVYKQISRFLIEREKFVHCG